MPNLQSIIFIWTWTYREIEDSISVPLISSSLNSFLVINNVFILHYFWFAKMLNLPALLASMILSRTICAISHISGDWDSGNSCDGHRASFRNLSLFQLKFVQRIFVRVFSVSLQVFSFLLFNFIPWMIKVLWVLQFTGSSTIYSNSSSVLKVTSATKQ